MREGPRDIRNQLDECKRGVQEDQDTVQEKREDESEKPENIVPETIEDKIRAAQLVAARTGSRDPEKREKREKAAGFLGTHGGLYKVGGAERLDVF